MKIDYSIPNPNDPKYAKRGTVVGDDGQVVCYLTDQADMTSRLLSDNQPGAEWRATAIKPDGDECMVYWIHDEDDETEPENYDWDNIDRIEEY